MREPLGSRRIRLEREKQFFSAGERLADALTWNVTGAAKEYTAPSGRTFRIAIEMADERQPKNHPDPAVRQDP